MDPSKEDNFEDQWRELFRDASETPPDSIWARVEAHLDEEQDKIVPLIWWRSPKIWLAAASVAAVLMAGGIYMKQQNDITVDAISKNTAIHTEGRATGEITEQLPAPSVQADNIIKEQKPTSIASKENAATTDISSNSRSDSEQKISETAGRFAGVPVNTSSENGQASSSFGSKSKLDADMKSIAEAKSEPVMQGSREFSPSTDQVAQTSPASTLELPLLSPNEARELDIYVQKRYVFFKPSGSKTDIEPVKKSKEYWAAVSFMPSTFNPNLKVNEAPQNFSTNAFSRTKSTSGTSKSGTSYAYQTMGGVKVSKHWTVELGLSYLQGNSTYQGGGYLLSSYNDGAPANVLESAYADLNNKGVPASPTFGFSSGLNSVYIDVTKEIQNNYRYLQLPLQAGYTLNPDGRLSYGVVGGVMTNFFLSNELESANGSMITTTADDDVYKSVNWAATTGLRLSYKFSPKWKANLTGSYQKALNSTLKSNQSLDSHPYLYGVSWGVRYTF